MITTGFMATEWAIRQEISELMDHFRFPRTVNHRAELDAIVAELIFWFGQLRALEAVDRETVAA